MAIDARISELFANVRLAHTPLDGSQEKVDAERSAISPGLTDYGSQRNQIFEQLVELIEDENPDHTAVDAWRTAVASWGGIWNSTVVKAESGIKDASSSIFLWVQKCGIEEERFWQYLAKAEVAAEARDFIAKYRQELQEKTEALERKWEGLGDAHERFGVSEKEAVDELKRLVDEVAQEYSAANRDLEEKTVNLAKEISQVGGVVITAAATFAGAQLADNIAQAVGVIRETIERGAEYWEAKRGGAEVRMERIRNAFRADRDTVLVMFKEFRADAETFVKDRGYGEVTARMEKGRSALADFNSNGGSTSGLQKDAAALVSLILPKLQAQADRARLLWDEFLRKHDRKFLGALSTDFRAALLNVDGASWDSQFQGILSQNLNQLAQNFLDRPADRFINLDQTDMPDAWRDQIRERIRDSVERFIEAQKKMKDTFQTDALTRAILGEFQVTQEELDKFR